MRYVLYFLTIIGVSSILFHNFSGGLGFLLSVLFVFAFTYSCMIVGVQNEEVIETIQN